MSDQPRSDYALGVLLLFLAAEGGHWLITPAAHPTATGLQYGWAWAQLLVCGVAGWRMTRRVKPPASSA